MNTLEFLLKRYQIDFYQSLPIELPYSRFKELPKIFRKLGFIEGAEIGVSGGFYSKILCRAIPNLHLYCIDPWNAYDEYVEAHNEEGQVRLDNQLVKARERLAPYNAEFIQKYSMDAVKDFEDESLDFVFIDGNHSFEYVIEDIAKWSKKVKQGGIISGHDYWNSCDGRTWGNIMTEEERIKLCQVKDAVDIWTKTNFIKPWFILKGDKCPSWFWIK